MTYFIVRSAEISLKGNNRHTFEQCLTFNINAHLKKKCNHTVEFDYSEGRMYGKTAASEQDVRTILKDIPGIYSFSIINRVEKTYAAIEKTVLADSKHFEGPIAVESKRLDKKFELTSAELSGKIGGALVNEGFSVNLKQPKTKIYIDVNANGADIFYEKIEGLGGMPIGSAGNVLCLLSGGIDSIVAAFHLMLRGCHVDFLHFHTYATGDEVMNSKIPKMIEALNRIQLKSTLYLIPYPYYQMKVRGKIDEKFDLVLFKHTMFHVADALALEKGYLALVSGDSVGQVASQTLENIAATRLGLTLPVFSPLISLPKDTITQQCAALGILTIAHQEYADCCSIVSQRPDTKVKLDKMRQLIKDANVEGIVATLRSKIETKVIQ